MPALLRVSFVVLFLSALVSPCQAGKQLGSQAHREDSHFSAEALEQGRFQSVHNAHYSVIANPYTLKYQNCTEHMLDFLFSAIYDTADMAQIKSNQRAWFKAQRLDLSPFKQLLAATFTRDIYTLDHPDQLETATFDTIAHFLVSNGLAQPAEIIE